MAGEIPESTIYHLLDSLPVEISFIDAKDAVRYFSKGDSRIFARSPAVIGKKVQNCHPPKSIDKVNAILDGFRGGKTDSAEFWINMNGRVIYIRYFAVRNSKKKYLGCLEVTQDITDIQKITGEKRLA